MPSFGRPLRASREILGLNAAQFGVLSRLDTPERIQDFVSAIPSNFEQDGDTCLCVRQVLRQKRAHCIEAAMLAACAFWIHGQPPYLMDIGAVNDDDHVVALFRRRAFWGAISKTNGISLRYRDPVYRSLRELALSFLPEYTNRRGEHTMRTYSVPLDLRRMPASQWVTNDEGCWGVVDRLNAIRHFQLVTPAQGRRMRRSERWEREIRKIRQYEKP